MTGPKELIMTNYIKSGSFIEEWTETDLRIARRNFPSNFSNPPVKNATNTMGHTFMSVVSIEFTKLSKTTASSQVYSKSNAQRHRYRLDEDTILRYAGRL